MLPWAKKWSAAIGIAPGAVVRYFRRYKGLIVTGRSQGGDVYPDSLSALFSDGWAPPNSGPRVSMSGRRYSEKTMAAPRRQTRSSTRNESERAAVVSSMTQITEEDEQSAAPSEENQDVWCAGCGRKDDAFVRWSTVHYIQCDECDYWHHTYCVGLWAAEAVTQASVNGFTCKRCLPSKKPTTRQRVGETEDARPCTPSCTGSCGGKGCAEGMPAPGAMAQRQIVSLVKAEARMMEAFLKGKPLSVGEKIVYQQDSESTALLGIVRTKYDCGAAVEVKLPDGTTKVIVARHTTLARFPPGYTTEELEVFAVRYGCIWGVKQLRFEMRQVRRVLGAGLNLPTGIVEHIKNANKRPDEEEAAEE